MDAIELIRKDHQKVEKLFKEFERTTDRATTRRRDLRDEIVFELVRHSMVEEEFLYPAVRERADEDLALEALEEHHVVKWLLLELNRMDPEHERFGAKMKVLIESVRMHVEEEETGMFKELRKAFSKDELEDLGALMESGKDFAPTRPHPRAPDQPPGNLIAGMMAAMMDRGRDLLSDLGELRAPRELAARVSKRIKPRRA